MVAHHLSDVEIACLPSDLPEFIVVDLIAVELNQVLHLSDLKLPKGVEVVALSHGHADQAVVSIHPPRKAEELPTGAPVAGETEVTSEKPEKEDDKK